MDLHYPHLGQNWNINLTARRYGFLLCENPISTPHNHDFFELGYILTGEMEHQFLGTSSLLVAGDYYFVDLYTPHSYRGSSDIQLLNFMFFPEVLDSSFKKLTSLGEIANSSLFQFHSDKLPLLKRRYFHDEDQALLKHLNQIEEELEGHKPGHHQMIHTMIIQLVILLMRADNEAQEPVYEQPVIQKILRYMEEEYAADLTLKEISARLGYSSAYVSRLFKLKLRTSFTEYLQRLRLANSCRLLLETDQNIEEIAAAVGYQNVQFYYRLFRRYYALTPQQYRHKKS